MFTISIKGKQHTRDHKMVKLELIFFKTGYARVPKVLEISGSYKEWSNSTQSFKSNSSDATSKNKMLFDEKIKYQKIAESWNAAGRNWSPVELSHAFDEEIAQKKEVKVLSVAQMLDYLYEKNAKKERYKNGKIITSISTGEKYKSFKRL